MKTIISIMAITAIVICQLSCQKERINKPGRGLEMQEHIQPVPSPGFQYVSDWAVPQMYIPGTDRHGNLFYTGLIPYTTHTGYDKNTHVELAYMKIPPAKRGDEPQYLRLPAPFKLMDNSQNMIAHVELQYAVGQTDPGQSRNTTGMNIYIKCQEPNSFKEVLEEMNAQGFSFRLIIIPKCKYQGTDTDWDNYREVATVLNCTP